MVAIFKTGSSLSAALNYNEHKVQKGVAEFIMAENYPMEYHRLTFDQKLYRLENQAALNENVTRNSVHISLNFDASEDLQDDKLKEIAKTYMDQIGFGNQPYLVYRHYDSGHPHIHIVSLKVGPDGKRIDTQNIGKNQSEKARKEIEISFGLIKAEDSKNSKKYKIEPVSIQKVQYGKTETKQAISNVLSKVLDTYKYSSLPELNALLKLYNIVAERGSETSRMYKAKGLMYRALDEQGNKIGAPIKASQFYMKPTLNNLEQKFLKNAVLKQKFRSRIKNAIDMAFLKRPGIFLGDLIKQLEKEGISTVLRENEQGRLYGITYIDHINKVVFNGSDLGKAYSAKAIQEKCGWQKSPAAGSGIAIATRTADQPQRASAGSPSLPPDTDKSILDILMQPEQVYEPMPYQFRKTSKRKKRKRPSNDR